MAVLDELLVGLGFDYDPDGLEQFEEDLGKTTDMIAGLAKAALAGAAAITAMVTASTAATDEQGKLAKELGLTVDEIDALGFAAGIAGDNADAIGTSLSNLASRASEAARGAGAGVEAFGLLGISATDANGNIKKSSDLMLEVSQRFQGLSKERQIELAEKLGLRDSLRLLQQGPSAINELTMEARALGVATEEDAAVAADFQDSLVRIWTVVKDFTRTLTSALAPAMTDFNNMITDWWKTNRDLIQQNLPMWIDNITKAFKILLIVMGAIIALKFAGHLITFIKLIRSASIATLAFNAAMALIPILIGLIIAAIVLLADDAQKFFNGQDSFLGDMLKKYPEWADKIKTVAAVFATISEVTGMIFDGWNKIFGLFENATFDDFKEFLSNIPGFLGDVTGISTIEDRQNEILNPSSGGGSSAFVDAINITVPGSANPVATGAAVVDAIQQAWTDLTGTVDQ